MFKDNLLNLAQEISAIDDSIAVKVEHIHRIPSKVEKFLYMCEKMSEKGKRFTISVKREEIMDVENAKESNFKSVFYTTGSYDETDATQADLRKEWVKLYQYSAREAVKDEALRNETLDRILGIHPQDYA